MYNYRLTPANTMFANEDYCAFTRAEAINFSELEKYYKRRKIGINKTLFKKVLMHSKRETFINLGVKQKLLWLDGSYYNPEAIKRVSKALENLGLEPLELWTPYKVHDEPMVVRLDNSWALLIAPVNMFTYFKWKDTMLEILKRDF